MAVGQLPFVCGDVVLLRSPALPFGQADEAQIPGLGRDPDEGRLLTEYIRRLGRGHLLPEAVELSSPSLSAFVEEIGEGSPPRKLKELRSGALSLTKYQLRMATRPTPFGLLAGVATARFGSAFKVRFGHSHRTLTRPDMAWLMQMVRRLERRPQVLPQLRVLSNGAHAVRGGRLFLTYASNTDIADAANPSRKMGVSVRHTPVVAEALRLAAAPVAVTDLANSLAAAFPDAPPAAIQKLLEKLVEHEFLLTDLRPPFDLPNPLDHVLERLMDTVPECEILRSIRQDMESYDRLPVGCGQTELRRLQARMRSICDVEKPLQVDLALDADVSLPAEVAREAEAAAALLWRIGTEPPGHPLLRGYHLEFLERYGTDRVVPLLEVLDPLIGLDAPSGYLCPPSRYRAPFPRPEQDKRRDQTLADLLASATRDGRREVVLDEEAVSALTSGEHPDELVPPSLELFTFLVSPSPDALEAGEFRLVLTGDSPVVGATFGRFAHLLGESSDEVAAMTRSVGTYDPRAVRANVVFQPRRPRSVNVALAPQWFDYRITIGVGPYRAEDKELRLSDLAVGATLDRLYLISRRLGREVVPTPSTVLNIYALAPNVARFLQEVGMEGSRLYAAWDWGSAGQATFLPRVRYGRSVLYSARWQLSDALRDGRPEGLWLEAFQRWRARWRPPAKVVAATTDQRIPLDLNDPLHLRVLRHEANRRTGVFLQELPAGEEYQDGWLTGPDGPHGCELVVPLLRSRVPVTSRPHAPVLTSAREAGSDMFQPGGEWLFAKLYSTGGCQNELLRDHLRRILPDLLSAGQADRWFYVRYHDPEPHLRLRFHGRPENLWSGLLPALHDWTGWLRRGGLGSHIVLDAYDPELERYGGPALIADAERAFQADSEACLTMLRILESTDFDLDPLLLTAASLVDLMCGFAPANRDGGTGWFEWLEMTGGKADHREAFAACRQAAVTLIDPDRDWPGLPGRPYGEALKAAWEKRRALVSAYGRRVQALAAVGRSWTSVERIALSMLHMHCNRLMGGQRDAEGQALAIARGALRVHQDRARFAS